jgi:hypothetical protein
MGGDPIGQIWPVRGIHGKILAQIEQRALFDLLTNTDRFNNAVGVVAFSLIERFSLGSADIHARSMQ